MRGIYSTQNAKNKTKNGTIRIKSYLLTRGSGGSGGTEFRALKGWNVLTYSMERRTRQHSALVATHASREVETSQSKRTLCSIPTRSIAKKQKLNWAKRSCGSALQLALSCATNSAVRAAEIGGTSDDSPSSVITSSCRNPTQPNQQLA